MTARNGQGPKGKGPMTGRGLGRCRVNAPKQASTQTEPAATDGHVGT